MTINMFSIMVHRYKNGKKLFCFFYITVIYSFHRRFK